MVFGEAVAAEAEQHQFGGKTDWFTINELATKHGYTLDEIAAKLPNFARAISEVMARIIANYDVRRLPNALETVVALHEAGEVAQGIVTGNVGANVPIKLHAAGFDPDWFTFGAYGDESANRNDLPPLALRRAADLLGRELDPARVLIVGDTVRDVEAARAAGVRVCIVETGYADPAVLREAAPDYLLPDLTTFDTVLQGH
ncbi:MAG: HAD hydrolase-like protein [Chloroflexota bacterium]